MTDSKKDFSSVQFDEPDELYVPGVDISPSYVLPAQFTASSRDWIGLYKVGWRSSKDYYTFEWAPAVKSEDRRVMVTFQKRRLPPHDDGTFYQFCYVARDGSVRGVSSAFQISNQPISGTDDDDLECLEIEDGDMTSVVLVRSKNQEVAEELARAKEEASKLKSMHQQVETEREALKERLVNTETEREKMQRVQEELRMKLGEERESMLKVELRVKELEKQTEVLNANLEESSSDNKVLKKKISEEQKAREQLFVKVHDSEREVQSLQAALEAVQQQSSHLKVKYEAKDNESDILKQQIYDLNKEKEALVVRVTKSEGELQEKTAINLQLNDKVAQQNYECDRLMSKLGDTEMTLQEHERLAKLHADQLTLELADVRAEQEQLKRYVIAVKDELEGTKKALASSRDDANIAQENVIEIMGSQEKLEVARGELFRLQCEAQGEPGDNGPMYALNLAHQQALRARDRLKQEKETLKRELAEAKRKEATLKHSIKQLKEQMDESSLREENVALKEQVVDLNRRLKMGADVYKEKYIECHDLSLKLKKLQQTNARLASQTDVEGDVHEAETDVNTVKIIADLRKANAELKAFIVSFENQESQVEQHKAYGTQSERTAELQAISEAETDLEIEKLRLENEQLRGKCLELQATIDVLGDSNLSYVHVSSQSAYEEQEHMEQLAAELADRRQRENDLKEEVHKLKSAKEVLEEEQKQLADRLELFESEKQEELEGILGDLRAQLQEVERSKQLMADNFKTKEQEMMEQLEASDAAVAKQMEDIEKLQEKLRDRHI
ncbi:LOW QUALITY PROTEIN: tax1-binding protein 1 homolog B-like [Corticium candelabrum]|uniref:LOW QUALITY PROTEIN: tax1-binding protein 1 homolog B-like n=1 Tax=Corticium candelabrum TaxID=121492 RepID=UPI002E25D7D4|nr:LOW QUALITY PROTEIN: tax1-binding protein 1 homolog B-like [Corticium candelabrum]